MLRPEERMLSSDALRPPAGYHLADAIGTTFSLDLLSLLQAPLAFTFFAMREDGATADPLALLESLRLQADKMLLFCQGGRIAVPAARQRLFAYLEDCVVEVTPARGVFHPKLWLLKFSNKNAEMRPCYRLIVASRNITPDRSWDTLLVLDGELVDRQNAFTRNHPLGDFIQALATLPGVSLTPAQQQRIERMQYEVRRVAFAAPEGFSELAFHPLGIKGYGTPFPGHLASRPLLIVAPFVEPRQLQALCAKRKRCRLVTRLEAAQALSREDAACLEEAWVLHEDAVPEPGDPADISDASRGGAAMPESPETPETSETSGMDGALQGLHAKLYIMDDGHEARIWTGSANATAAAFHHNVELLVELRGRKKDCGIDRFLGQDGFAPLLRPYVFAEPVQGDRDVEACEALLEETRYALARAHWLARISPLPPDDDGRERFACALLASEGPAPMPSEVRIRCRPATLGTGFFKSLSDDMTADFSPLAFEELSCFVVFSLEVTRGTTCRRAEFALKATLEGLPADRRERLLQSILKDRNQVLRLLLLMLQDQQVPMWTSEEGGTTQAGAAFFGGTGMELPLLEVMLDALRHAPERLDRVARLVCELSAHEEGRALLPEGFEAIWPAIKAAREGLAT